jgi:hypothetical protein
MQESVADCSMRKRNNKRKEFSTGKMGYFFYNFITGKKKKVKLTL